MSKWIKILIMMFLVGLMVFCYGRALTENSTNQGGAKVHILYKEGNPLTGREAMDLLEMEEERENPLNVTLWGELEGQSLRFDEFNREANVSLVVVSGNSSLLFSSRYSLGRGAYDEILLSSDVAHRLFGNTGARGIPIRFEGREYIFRGIIEGAENTAVIQGGRQTPRILDGAAVEIPYYRGQASIIREFQVRFWVADRVFDLGLLKALGNLFTILLPVVMGGVLVFKGVRQGLACKTAPAKGGVWVGLTAVIFFSFLWLNRELPRVELDFTPTMWSDFQYWRYFFEGKLETMGIMLSRQWRSPEQIAIESAWIQMLYGFFALGLFVGFVRKVTVESWWSVLLYGSVSFVTAFGVIVGNGRNDFPGVWSLWGVACFYLIAKKLLEVNLDDEEDERIIIVFED